MTAEEIQAAFQRNLTPDNLAIVSIGPKAPQIRPADSDADVAAAEEPADRAP